MNLKYKKVLKYVLISLVIIITCYFVFNFVRVKTAKVNIILNPASLGKVALQIANTSEGLSAQFTVATQEARDLIMKGLDSLKESLLSQGVNVDNVSVKLNDTQKSEYNQDWTEQEGSKGGNKHYKEHRQKEEQNFEQLMFGLNDDEEKNNV